MANALQYFLLEEKRQNKKGEYIASGTPVQQSRQ
jgi:hypothetical protein